MGDEAVKTGPGVAPEQKPKRRVTKKGLGRLQEKMFLKHAPDLLDAFYDSLLKRVKAQDAKAIELVAKLHRLVDGTSGTNINIIQNNQNSGSGRARGFESIVRMLERTDNDALLLEAGAADAKRANAEVIDAECEDLPNADSTS